MGEGEAEAESRANAVVRVLVVADPLVRRSLRGRLGQRVVVVEAGGIHEARCYLRCAAFEAVITEQRMLDGSGSALLDGLRAMFPACRRALISSEAFFTDDDPPYQAFFIKSPKLDLDLRAWLNELVGEASELASCLLHDERHV